jgi:hypothetical protein
MHTLFYYIVAMAGICGQADLTTPANPVPGAVSFTISLFMTCNSAQDEVGSREEIYGDFYLRVNGTSHALLAIPRADAISIAAGDTIYFAPMVVLTDMPFRNAEDIVYFKELIIGGQLFEKDRIGKDEVFGSRQADYSDEKGQLKFFPTTFSFRRNGSQLNLTVEDLQFKFGH